MVRREALSVLASCSRSVERSLSDFGVLDATFSVLRKASFSKIFWINMTKTEPGLPYHFLLASREREPVRLLLGALLAQRHDYLPIRDKFLSVAKENETLQLAHTHLPAFVRPRLHAAPERVDLVVDARLDLVVRHGRLYRQRQKFQRRPTALQQNL